MNDPEYQQEVMRTVPEGLSERELLSVAGLGLAGETGEVVDLLKKYLFHGHPLDMAKIHKELGDVMWYFTLLCNQLGFTLGGVKQGNSTKLRERYPEGFSSAESLNRKPEDEQPDQQQPAPMPDEHYQELKDFVLRCAYEHSPDVDAEEKAKWFGWDKEKAQAICLRNGWKYEVDESAREAEEEKEELFPCAGCGALQPDAELTACYGCHTLDKEYRSFCTKGCFSKHLDDEPDCHAVIYEGIPSQEESAQ